MEYLLEYRTIWECGQRKDSDGNPHQEDSIYPPSNSNDESDRLFIVCDGMGGHDCGEVASSIVCESLTKSLGNNLDDSFDQKIFNDALANAYAELDKVDNGSSKKMGTTLAFLKLYDHGALVAHIGDSRVYHIRPGIDGAATKILSKTEDHSLVNELVKIGELTPEEAKVSKSKNVITRAMQPNTERCEADIFETADILPGDYFYLCSDGMLEQMEDDAIRNIFSNAGGDIDEKVKILIGATSKNKDNHSAILVRVIDVYSDSVKEFSRKKFSWKRFFKI